MKRFREVVAKPNELRVAYGKFEGETDVFYAWGKGTDKSDSRVLMDAFGRIDVMDGEGKSLIAELKARGYDLTTLKFSIQKTTKVSA